jgi:hypothetical protein
VVARAVVSASDLAVMFAARWELPTQFAAVFVRKVENCGDTVVKNGTMAGSLIERLPAGKRDVLTGT